VTRRNGVIRTKFGVNLPTRVPVGGVVYSVYDRRLRGKRTFGLCDPVKLEVVIDVAKHASALELFQTWEHEVGGHCVEAETGIKRPHSDLNAEAHMRTQILSALIGAQDAKR